MIGKGLTVFQGNDLKEFRVHILGVMSNVIGTRRDLVLARLEGEPLDKTGVIAGMSGSPVYIDGRLLGAVSYSLGQFSTEPIAGITPIEEMRSAALNPDPRFSAAKIDLSLPITSEGLRASLRDSFSWVEPFGTSANALQIFDDSPLVSRLAMMLRPIATPLTIGGFSQGVLDPLLPVLRQQGFIPSLGLLAGQEASPSIDYPLRPGDSVGISLMSGDLEFGATGTVTQVEGNTVYAFGHPFYNLGPIQFPMTRAYVHAVLPSLTASTKLSSAGDVIGTVSQDRATTVAGTLGPGPDMIPVSLTLRSKRSDPQTFHLSIVQDQLMTPLLAYLSVLNTLAAYERQAGAASFKITGTAAIQGYDSLMFDNMFSGDQSAVGAASAVIGPINVLLRNSFENIQLESLNLEIDANEQPREATLERVWLNVNSARPGSTVTVNATLRTYRGDEILTSLPVDIPVNARGAVSLMVADSAAISSWEVQEFQAETLSSRSLAAMIGALNDTRRNDLLYVQLLGSAEGTVIQGEVLASLPPSVLAVMEGDRHNADTATIRTTQFGEWEIPIGLVVSGSRTLTLTLED
jgi:hypothetical protein